ncbi:non-ribosomal peptide synthetase, partial [Maribacter sp. 2307UL18-2]|uniref:non-ribosomal peptide synthetase n=1 Tax=Maribacter sp. 2307UL18-2 TaxID=3386274 RepID=UPI0039BC8FE6
ESNDGIYLNFEYSTDLFKASTINRFILYFKEIVFAVISNPSIKLSQIDILSIEERDTLLKGFNKSGADYSIDYSIVEMFEEQVLENPDRVAVVIQGERHTYKELNERSNQLANYLVSFGIVPGSVVGLLLDRSVEMIIGILGVLKSGAGYLPIDTNLPAQRVEYMLDQSRSTLLLTEGTYLEQYSAYLPVRNIHSEDLYMDSSQNIGMPIEPNDLAYCIFTSGSTGLPKGVMMGHKSVINLVQGLRERVYSSDHGSKSLRVALLASYSFDASVQQIFGALLLGHSLYICDDLDRKDGDRLIDFYNRNGIEVSDGTPTHLRILMSSLDEDFRLTSLRIWMLAGEVLSKELVKEFYKYHEYDRVKLFNIYGPTETCVDSTSFEIELAKLDDYSTIPIGKPLPNERIYITDKYGNLVPIGVTGELCIAGDGLAQRYIGDMTLTSEKFIDHWIPNEKKVYRTGDLACWLSDGNIEYQGRRDNQVKIRGYRIELGEIENQLLAYEEVRDIVVVAKERGGSMDLIAYIVSDNEIKPGELRSYLALTLPDYMLPVHYVQMDSFPLTPNGKVDRRALPDPELTTSDDYVGP